MTVKEPFNRPCPACGAEPGRGCIEDDMEQPMTGHHMGRSLRRAGPITIRHTGEFHSDGGAILELQDAETEEVEP
jgi:hypothetical protein